MNSVEPLISLRTNIIRNLVADGKATTTTLKIKRNPGLSFFVRTLLKLPYFYCSFNFQKEQKTVVYSKKYFRKFWVYLF